MGWTAPPPTPRAGLLRGEIVMDEENYWQRLAARRLSRRRLLAGAAGVGAGLAAVSLAGCGGGGEDGGTATPGASRPAAGAAGATGPPAASATPIVLEPAKTRGGIMRWFSFQAMTLDTMDPHQSQLGPLFTMHSPVFSTLLQYEDPYNAV